MGKAVKFVNAANAGLALGGVALLIGMGADGCGVALAALAAAGGAMVAAFAVAYILKGGAA